MSKSALNTSLQRTLKKGTQYNALFLASSCEPVSLGKGDTKYGINQIKEWILENINSIDSKLARKLFLGASLSETCTNIHSFLYDHFQYDADGYKQNLRSPNCSWAMRQQGIDCKSYSILASTLLLKCGYKNILRRIQQPTYKPTEYTHIYVIVPINQTTGTLNQGYYVIDGTIPTMHEPLHTNPHDITMDLPYYGLKGATTATTVWQQQQQQQFIKAITPYVSQENVFKINDYITRLINAGVTPIYSQFANTLNVSGLIIPINTGLNGTSVTDGTNVIDTDTSTSSDNGFSLNLEDYNLDGLLDIDILNFLDDVDFSSFENFSNTISCFGGSAFGSDELTSEKVNIREKINKILLRLNEALLSKNVAEISAAIQEYKVTTYYLYWAGEQKRAEGWNNCSTNNIDEINRFNWSLWRKGSAALDGWLNKYFNVLSEDPSKIEKRNSSEFVSGLFIGGLNPPIPYAPTQEWFKYYNIEFKKTLNQVIPAFVITDYIFSLHDYRDFDYNTYEQGLDTGLPILFTNPNDTTTGTLSNNQPRTAGSSLLFGGILLALAGGYAYNEFVVKPKSTTQKTKQQQ